MAGLKKGPWGWITATFKVPRRDGPFWWLENAVSALHVKVFQLFRGRFFGTFDGAPLLVLHTVGAKSGQPRQSPMIYLGDGDNYVVVASIGGQPRNPAWYHNLRARADCEADVRGGRRALRARQATAEEAAALWPRLTAIWPAWDDYKTRTNRDFPVMILEPR